MEKQLEFYILNTRMFPKLFLTNLLIGNEVQRRCTLLTSSETCVRNRKLVLSQNLPMRKETMESNLSANMYYI